MKSFPLVIALLGASLGTQNALAQAASAASAASPKSRTEVKSETAAAARAGQLKGPEEGAIVGVANGKAARENTRALERRSKAQEAAAAKSNGARPQAASAPN